MRLKSHIGVLLSCVAVVGAASPALAERPPGSTETPTAAFAITPGSGNLNLKFTAVASGFPSSVVSYQWDFGDGDSQTTKTNSVSHTYAKAAKYSPSLTEMDGEGDGAGAAGAVSLFTCGASSHCTET